MKKISSLLLLLLCNIVCLQAQENRIVELEKSLEIIRTDLQQKKLDTYGKISGCLRSIQQVNKH